MAPGVVIPWVLAGLFALLSLVLWIRRQAPDHASPRGAGASREVPPMRDAGASGGSGGAGPRDTGPRDTGDSVGAEDLAGEALQGLFRYVETSVLHPLSREGDGRDIADRVQDAVNALEDLGFYARPTSDEAPRTENLVTLIRAVTREYALETGVAVRFSGPTEVLTVRVAPEGFKDALYLLLVNAGHFGGGQPIDVVAEPEEDKVRVSIRDRGPGFSEEALRRAFRPFWTSEKDALGLGLAHARKVLGAQGSELSVRNPEGGGARADIVVPRGR